MSFFSRITNSIGNFFSAVKERFNSFKESFLSAIGVRQEPPAPELSPEEKLQQKLDSISNSMENQIKSMESLGTLDHLVSNGQKPDLSKVNDKDLGSLYNHAMMDQTLNQLDDRDPDSILNTYEKQQSGVNPTREQMETSLGRLAESNGNNISDEQITGLKTFKAQNIKISIEGAADMAKFDHMNLAEKQEISPAHAENFQTSLDKIKGLKQTAVQTAEQFEPVEAMPAPAVAVGVSKEISPEVAGMAKENLRPVELDAGKVANAPAVAPKVHAKEQETDIGG